MANIAADILTANAGLCRLTNVSLTINSGMRKRLRLLNRLRFR
jgi:hypothetical protein